MEIINTLPTEHKRKRYNKNKKKSWRKKVDMKDVEEVLEEARQEERYGGPLGERESTELMFLDVGDGKKLDVDGNEEVKEKLSVVNKGKPDNVLKPSKKKRSTGPLHCHKFLSGLGGAKDPKRGNRNKVKELEEKMNPVTKKKVVLASKSVKAQTKVKRMKASREEVRIRKLNKPQSNRLLDYSKDLWEEEKPLDTVEESWLKDGILFRDRVTQKAKIKIPLTRDKKTSALPSLAVPMPGQSYNPRYEDHQKLMKRAIEHEEIKQDRIERPMRTTYNAFPKMGTHNTDKTWMKEMSEGLPTQGAPAEEQEVEYQETTEEQLEADEDNEDWEDVDDDEEDMDDEEDLDEEEEVEEGDKDMDPAGEDDDNEEEDSEDDDKEEGDEKEKDITDENESKDTVENKGVKRSLDELIKTAKKSKKIETNNNRQPNNKIENERKLKKEKKEALQKLVTVSHGGTNNPKPAQQRRKEKELKLAAEERTKEKELKQRESQVFRVKSLQKEIDKQQQKKDSRKAKRDEKLKNQMYKPGRMNYFRYREHDLAVALGDELADSLRSVKPKTNLMEEHFNRLQKRNMVETRIRRKVKRKPKRMIKRDQKVDYSNVDKLAKES